MSAITDAAYINALAAFNRVRTLGTFDPNTTIGSAFWTLNTYLQFARGETIVNGTLSTAEQRATVLDANGELTPAGRTALQTLSGQLNSAFPVTSAGNSGIDYPPIIAVDEPFLGGILDGEIFGINKKLIAVGVIAFFVLKGK